MTLLTPAIRAQLEANRGVENAAPVLKLFNPAGAATWLATEIGEDGDTLFGLADLGFACPELGYFSLGEIERIRLPYGLRIERDIHFESARPIMQWWEMARACGSISTAEACFSNGLAAVYGDIK